MRKFDGFWKATFHTLIHTKMSITTPLQPLQTEAVKWLQRRETHSEYGVVGGMFCDDPGMGKTLALISLILSDREPGVTLVVSPSNVIDVWKQEIQKHTNLPTQQIITYHGSRRNNCSKQLDTLSKSTSPIIVLTSYGIVRSESNERTFQLGSLLERKYKRVILDEAHYIKGHNTKTHESIMNLQATIKWIVTATPLFNELDENYAYFRFLGIIENKEHWRRLIPATKKKIAVGNLPLLTSGLTTINEWKRTLLLRRDKSQLNLPPKTEYVEYVDFSEQEASFYEALYKYSVRRMDLLQLRIKNGTLNQYGKFLSQRFLILILRLRQACLNPWLVIRHMKQFQQTDYNAEQDITLEHATKMLEYMNSNIHLEQECPICVDAVANYVATPCGHKLCKTCWAEVRNRNAECPFCRVHISEIYCQDKVPEISLNDIVTPQNDITEERFNVSSKVNRAIDIIRANIGHTKIVVVSQWVDVLDHVEKNLGDVSAKVVKITGKVPLPKRLKYIDAIQNDPDTRVCLLSLNCSAEGITLTEATVLIHLDPWWNELGKQEQMSNRIHRIGQTKDTKIIHLRIRNTIEDRIQLLRNRKNKIVGLSEHCIGSEEEPWMNEVYILQNEEAEVDS